MMTAVHIVLGLLLALLMSCTTTPKKQPQIAAPLDAKKELNQVQMDLAAGAEKKALQRLRHLIAKYPKSDVADDAGLQIAKIHFKNQKFEDAYKTYMSLVDSDVFSPNEAEALLGASRSLFKLGRLDESSALSQRGLKIPGISENMKLEFYRHRYTVLSTIGDRMESLRALAYIHAKETKPDVKASAQARAGEILAAGLSETDLEKIVGDPDFGFVRADAAFRLAQIKLRNKDFDGARSLFARAASWGQGTPVQAQAESYLTQIDSRRRVDPSVIGTVLPLTGRYQQVAYKTLRGLQLGLGIYGPDRSSFRLAVVDSEGTPEGAKHAVERLVTEDSVIAVVGSLLSRDASTVAAKTEELGVPSIALSQKAGLTQGGVYIFRNAVTSEMQVKELVRLAMDQLGMKRFALLYPNDTYGTEYANLFWDEVLARGGVIAGAQIYNPTETDFRGPIKRLVGTYYVEDRKSEYSGRVREWFKKQKKISSRQNPPDDLLPPIVDFDAIFVPDTPKALGQIAPMLAYQGVTGVRLLGTNVWNSGDLIRRGEKNVENALFVDTNILNDVNFKNSKFYRDFEKTFGEAPGLFEAQGYETGVLLRQLIAGGERTRLGLAQALGGVRQLVGVSGPMSMNEQREIVRPLTPFMVKGAEIVPWSMGLESTAAPAGSDKKTLRK
ncbi:MAG TPA: penicillin-binding protein activator [Bdellovibrionales bacterium]|nr:penicillin-binding protein activator [Bdellovibrionales bacterium]